MSLLLWIIHRHHCEQLLFEPLSTKEIHPHRKPVDSVTLFQEVILLLNIIVQCFERHKQNGIHLRCIEVKSDI